MADTRDDPRTALIRVTAMPADTNPYGGFFARVAGRQMRVLA